MATIRLDIRIPLTTVPSWFWLQLIWRKIFESFVLLEIDLSVLTNFHIRSFLFPHFFWHTTIWRIFFEIFICQVLKNEKGRSRCFQRKKLRSFEHFVIPYLSFLVFLIFPVILKCSAEKLASKLEKKGLKFKPSSTLILWFLWN